MTPAVRLVAPPAKVAGARLEGIRKDLASYFEVEKGWEVRTVRQRVTESRARGEGGRPYRLLEPQDAFQLYRAMHRKPVAVFQLAQTKVLIDPEAGPTERNVMSLERFVRYKCFFTRATVEVDWRASVSEAEAWAAGCACEGEHDARCLPLHTFAPSRDWPNLGTDQVDFERRHGKSGVRADERRRRWEKDKSAHGNDIDIVAGYTMQRGFHWDVEVERNISRIWNAKEVWSVTAGGHINVYPDASVRGGHLSKLVYESPRPAPELTAGPQTTKKKPKGRGRRR